MINVLKCRTFTLLVSSFILLGTIGTIAYKGYVGRSAFKYSVDFSGGTQLLLRFAQPVSSDQVREALEKGGWNNPTIRSFPRNNETLVRVQEFVNDAKGLGERIITVISQVIPNNSVQIMQTEGVGPSVGKELRDQSLRAICIALLALLIYIALVFWSYAYAVGAVVALFHDALVMSGLFLILDRDISINVIGAILAVLGYSINDTIVIFSRIRSNIKKMRGISLGEVVNVSINQTLRRTLLTSLSTSLAVGSMLILGGEALWDFSLTLLVGVIFGTYSSIFIASPVMMLLYNHKEESA